MWVEKHGPGWRIRDRIAGKIATVSPDVYPTKKAAQDARDLLRGQQIQGRLVLPQDGRITLTQWLDEWWPGHLQTYKPRAKDSENSRVRNHIDPLLGAYTLEDLERDPMIVQSWVAYLSAGAAGVRRRPLSPKSVRNVHGLLATILAAAVEVRRMRSNPCTISAKSLPARDTKEMRFLTDPEIERLVAALPEHWRLLVALLIATGLRWGEAIGLRVSALDLNAKRPKVRVVTHLHQLNSGELVFTAPKTEKSRRTVSVPSDLARALARLVAGRGRDEMVFTTPTGLLIRANNFRRVWLKALERAGIGHVRVHDLRHTHAAMLISAGRPLSAISRRLGHSSVAITDTIYGHLREEVDDGIIEAIDAAMAGVGWSAMAAEVDAEFADELAAA